MTRARRRRAAALALLALVAVAVMSADASAQSDEWTVTPAHPTVGDTVWLERRIAAPVGWRLRPGKLTAGEDVEALGDAVVLHTAEGWIVRYPVVAWTPGGHAVTLPPIWRLAPDGQTDSLPGGSAELHVGSVIPDSLRQPEPKGAIAPLRLDHRRPLVLIGAVGLALALGVGALAWRRRGPRPSPPPAQVPVEGEVPDARWLAAGEPKAVAARAAARVRGALARAGPRPSPALADLLEQLVRIEFAAVPEGDVAALVSRARDLTPERLA